MCTQRASDLFGEPLTFYRFWWVPNSHRASVCKIPRQDATARIPRQSPVRTAHSRPCWLRDPSSLNPSRGRETELILSCHVLTVISRLRCRSYSESDQDSQFRRTVPSFSLGGCFCIGSFCVCVCWSRWFLSFCPWLAKYYRGLVDCRRLSGANFFAGVRTYDTKGGAQKEYSVLLRICAQSS